MTSIFLLPTAPGSGSSLPAEEVMLEIEPRLVGPGPSDDVFVTVDAIGKTRPFSPTNPPPWPGPTRPPVLPIEGSFSHIHPNDPQFPAVHLWGAVRFASEVWHKWLERPFAFLGLPGGGRIELIPAVNWKNAAMGPGFVETGVWQEDGMVHRYALNVDVIAHEVGHAVVFDTLGQPDTETVDYLAIHEAVSDISALLVSLHFEGIIDRLFEETGGNLYVMNSLNRIAETSSTEQLRIASNKARLSEYFDLFFSPESGVVDPTGRARSAHDAGLPLLGAVFDMLVELVQDRLVAKGAIPPDDDVRGWSEGEIMVAARRFSQPGRHLPSELAFREALVEARERLGRILGRGLQLAPAADLDMHSLAAALLRSAAAEGEIGNLPAFLIAFEKRDIHPRPARFSGAPEADAAAMFTLRKMIRHDR